MITIFFIRNHPFLIKIFLLAINRVFAFLSAYYYRPDGRNRLQYGWAAVGIVCMFFIVINLVRTGKAKDYGGRDGSLINNVTR